MEWFTWACEAVFWLMVAFILYAYIGYPVVLFVLSSFVQAKRDLGFILGRKERRQANKPFEPPAVTFGFAAYNEEDVIESKLQNVLAMDYPPGKLEVIVASDGSDDQTEAIVARYAGSGVRLLADGERLGKAARINQIVAEAANPIVVLSDANTMFEPDAVGKIARHFDDEEVGAVSGEVRLLGPDGRLESESLYWRYEVMLKFMENKLNLIVGANGPIYAVRKDVYEPIADKTIVDDFVIPMLIRSKGSRVVYDPEAVAHEETTGSLGAEFIRRRRIGAGNWQAAGMLQRMLNPLSGRIAFSFWSHKIFRWLVPVAMIVALAANLLLLNDPVFKVFLGLQMAFYAAAGLGQIVGGKGVIGGTCYIPRVLVSMNLGLLLGLIRYFTGSQQVTWERSRVVRVSAEDDAGVEAPPAEEAIEESTFEGGLGVHLDAADAAAGPDGDDDTKELPAVDELDLLDDDEKAP